MSNDDWLRRQTEEQMRNHPHTPKVTDTEVRDYHDRTVINNHIDRVRRESERR